MSHRETSAARGPDVPDRARRAAAQRSAAEDALRVSEERLRFALDATSEVVWDWNVVEDRIYQSPRWAQMLGHPPEATPQNWSQLAPFFHPEDLPMIQGEIARALSGATDAVTFEHRVRAASGEWRCLLARARVVERNARGEGVRVVGVCADITAHKAAEEALREADRRRKQFLAVLSHELRNPLAAARNSLFTLDRVPPGGAQARSARAILDRQLSQLTRLVEDLLDVSRISSGKVHLQRTRLDLVSLAQRAVDENRCAFGPRALELRLDLPPGPVWIDCDPTRIVQVLGNLLHNAAKFTPRGNVLLAIDVEQGGAAARVRVRDTGVGIAAELLPRLFRPFEQAQGTLSRSEGGLGLGLALVKELVELHGGSVEARSDGPGAGAEFTVRLPLVAAPADVEGARTSGEPARCLRVVAVEDDEDAALVLGEVLALLGHDAEVARSGPEAIAMVRRVRPDVVLCDVGLPGMSGYDVAQVLRADAEFRDLPLVALTGYASPEDVRRAAEAGFDRHVAKPIPPLDLGDVLAAVTRAPRPRAG